MALTQITKTFSDITIDENGNPKLVGLEDGDYKDVQLNIDISISIEDMIANAMKKDNSPACIIGSKLINRYHKPLHQVPEPISDIKSLGNFGEIFECNFDLTSNHEEKIKFMYERGYVRMNVYYQKGHEPDVKEMYQLFESAKNACKNAKFRYCFHSKKSEDSDIKKEYYDLGEYICCIYRPQSIVLDLAQFNHWKMIMDIYFHRMDSNIRHHYYNPGPPKTHPYLSLFNGFFDIIDGLKTDYDIKKKEEEEKKRNKCVCCYENEKSHLFIDCSHYCVCEECLLKCQNVCPVCRTNSNAIRIFDS